jgi:N-formylglutamate amidohydrolase
VRACVRSWNRRVNTPYKGGYIVKHYGHVRGATGDGHVHSLQVEVNRALYLDEAEVKFKPDLCEALREDLEDLCHLLAKKAPKGKPKRHAKDKSEPQ